MTKCLEIAQKLELEILHKIELAAKEADSEQAYWQVILASQKKMLTLLSLASQQEDSFPEYPDVELETILMSKASWQEQLDKIQPGFEYQAKQLMELLMLEKANESLQEFYQQASGNVAHPLSKVFLTSLAEVKNLQNMRISMFTKVYNNKLWSILGYAPFYNN